MSGIGDAVCEKHNWRGYGHTCPQCQQEASVRMLQFVTAFNLCEGCTVKAGRITFLEHLLADEKKDGDAAYAKIMRERNDAVEVLTHVKRLLPADWTEMHKRIDAVLANAIREDGMKP